jgi:hypothetical protein
MKMDFRVYLGGEKTRMGRTVKHKGKDVMMCTRVRKTQAGPILVIHMPEEDEESIMWALMHENLHVMFEGIREEEASKALDWTWEGHSGQYVNQGLWNSFGHMVVMILGAIE